MGFEHLSKRHPTLTIETPGLVKALGCRVRHIKGMVSVVVSEQTLAFEREQPIYFSQPVVYLLEMFFVTEGINGVSEAQSTSDFRLFGVCTSLPATPYLVVG